VFSGNYHYEHIFKDVVQAEEIVSQYANAVFTLRFLLVDLPKEVIDHYFNETFATEGYSMLHKNLGPLMRKKVPVAVTVRNIQSQIISMVTQLTNKEVVDFYVNTLFSYKAQQKLIPFANFMRSLEILSIKLRKKIKSEHTVVFWKKIRYMIRSKISLREYFGGAKSIIGNSLFVLASFFYILSGELLKPALKDLFGIEHKLSVEKRLLMLIFIAGIAYTVNKIEHKQDQINNSLTAGMNLNMDTSAEELLNEMLYAKFQKPKVSPLIYDRAQQLNDATSANSLPVEVLNEATSSEASLPKMYKRRLLLTPTIGSATSSTSSSKAPQVEMELKNFSDEQGSLYIQFEKPAGFFYRSHQQQFKDASLVDAIEELTQTNRIVYGKDHKHEGLKITGPGEKKEFPNCWAKIKFHRKDLHVRIGVKSRLPTAAELELLGEECKGVLSPVRKITHK
jgi:hypothetical protein